MNSQLDKPDFVVDEMGGVQDVRNREFVPEPASPAGWIANGPCTPGGGSSSEAARPAPRPGGQIRLIPIPIGLIISLVALLISNTGNGDDRRAINRFNEGNDYFDVGSYGQAIAKYDEAIERKPDFPEAYYNRGLAHAARDDYDLAIADWNQVLLLRPGVVRAYFSRGSAYYMQGEIDKAIADFDQAIERSSGFSSQWWETAAGHGVDGIPAVLQDSLSAVDLSTAYTYRGAAYLDKGQVDQALADLDKAIELQPSLALAYFARGVAYYYVGDYEQAIADLNTVLELDSDPELRQEAEALLEELGVNTEILVSW